MEIFWDLDSVVRKENSVLTVGTFDGVHLGHQFIIQGLKRRAANRHISSTLVTFNPHPQLVLSSPNKPKLKILTTIDEKIELLRALELDRLVIINFTSQFSKTTSDDFVKNVLFKNIGFCEIVIGHDHAFGKDRKGNIETLRNIGHQLGFSVEKLTALKKNGTVINSSKIRNLLHEGDVKSTTKALGRHYFINGKVVTGEGRGQSLNYPTANIELTSNDKLIPADGVYAVYVYYGNERFNGMMNIGSRPTFNMSSNHTLEVHLFNFNKTIYDENLKIEFVKKIREEMKFSGTEELITQLDNDKQTTLEILKIE